MAFPFVWVPQQTVSCNCKRLFKGTFSFLLFNHVFWGVNCGFLVSRDFNKLMYLPFGGKKKRYFTYFLNYISLYIKKIVKKYIKINKIAFTKKRVLERPKIVKTFHHKKTRECLRERERESLDKTNQPHHQIHHLTPNPTSPSDSMPTKISQPIFLIFSFSKKKFLIFKWEFFFGG